MSLIEQQIIETWYINHRTNLKIIDNLTEESLQLTTSNRGGGTVGHQLAHLYIRASNSNININIWPKLVETPVNKES